jgi:hypothetical protein
MISRLRDKQSFSDPAMARLAELVRSVPPASVSFARQRRVSDALGASRRLPSLLKRLVWLVAMSGGLAFAGTMTRQLISRPAPQVLEAPTPTQVVVARVVPRVPRVVIPSAPKVIVPAAPKPEVVDRGAALLSRSLVALRQAKDPELAGELVRRYLSLHPREILAEEAIAIGIEAADARHDRAEASSLAARYLLEYPTGRFTQLANAALAKAD